MVGLERLGVCRLVRYWLTCIWPYIALIMLFFPGCDNRTPEEIAEDNCKDTSLAFVVAREFVRDRLKSPSTAVFPLQVYDDVRVFYSGDCRHEIFAYVDAQNSFGATIRTPYYAKVEYRKATNRWILKNLDM